MKNYQYVLDVETPFIKKLYNKEDDYKVEFLTPYGTLEELRKLQKENVSLETKLAEKEKEIEKYKNGKMVILSPRQNGKSNLAIRQFNEWQNRVAIEQLEKVKTNILSNITFGIESVGIMNSIDNQIKQLKEGK